MVVGDGLGHVLQQHRLTGARRGDDQRALALALRRDQVDHAGRLVLDRRVLGIEVQPLIGIERREVVEVGAVTHCIGIVVVDLDQLGDREIALAVARGADLAFDRIAGAQAPFADLVRRNIDIVRPGKIVCLRAAQEAEAILQHLDRADAENFLAVLGHFLEDREHEILPAHGAGTFDAQLLGHRNQLSRRPAFEFFKMHFFCIPMSYIGMPAGRGAWGKQALIARNGDRLPIGLR